MNKEEYDGKKRFMRINAASRKQRRSKTKRQRFKKEKMKTKLEKLNTCMRVSIDKGYYGDVIILANQAKRIKEKQNEK